MIDDGDLEGLSGRERQVANLAATGASTRTIAESLFISMRTVETHLGSIYRKLDIASRSELVARLADRPSPHRPSLDTSDPLPPVPGLVAPAHFVGRAREVATIVAARTAACEAGRIVLIGGESGVGKSSLLAIALAKSVDGPTDRVLGGRCVEGMSTPFGPVIDALAPLLRALSGPLVEATGPNGGILASLIPDCADRLPASPGRFDSEAMPRLLLETFHHILRFVASAGPVTLVLEDVHWADQATTVFLRSLVGGGLTYPMCVIVSFRDTELAAGNALAGLLADLWRNDAIDRINLQGLSLGEAIDLADYFAADDETQPGSSTLPDRTHIARLHDASAGNAFYLTELLRVGGSAAEPGVDDLLPESLVDVVNHRVNRLGKATRTVLEAAAICGLDFSTDIVEVAVRTLGLVEDVSVLEVVEQAQEAGLLADTVASGADCRFVHDVVRKTLQDSISALRGSRLHAAIGHDILAQSDDLHRAAFAADHLSQSNVPADRIEAGQQVLRSLQSEVTSLAPDDAATLVATILDRLPSSADANRVRLELQIKVAWIHYIRLDTVAHRAAILDAVATAKAIDNPTALGRAMAAFRMVPITGHLDVEILDLVDEAVDGLSGPEHIGLRARLLGFAAFQRSFGGEGFAAEPQARVALHEARCADDDTILAMALYSYGGVMAGGPNVARQRRLLDELATLDVHNAEEIDQFDGLRFAGSAALQAADREAFTNNHREIANAARSTGSTFLASIASMWSGLDALLDGDLESAAAANDALLPLTARELTMQLSWLVQMLIIRNEQGRLAECIPVTEKALSEYGDLPATRALVAWVMAEAHEMDRAWDIVADLADADFTTIIDDWLLTVTLGWLTPVIVARGSTDQSRTLLRRLSPYAGQLLVGGSGVAVLGAIDRFIGMLLAHIGEDQAALDALGRAAALEESVGGSMLHTQTLLERARVLLHADQPGASLEIRELLESVEAASRHAKWPKMLERVTDARSGLFP